MLKDSLRRPGAFNKNVALWQPFCMAAKHMDLHSLHTKMRLAPYVSAASPSPVTGFDPAYPPILDRLGKTG